jgi:hypothetical protein
VIGGRRPHAEGVTAIRFPNRVAGLVAVAAAAAAFQTRVKPTPPPAAEVVCGPVQNGNEQALVWGVRDEHTGLHYWLGRYDDEARRIGDPIDVGWGYDGYAACVLARGGERLAIVWPFFDPYGGTPALSISLIENGRRVERRDVLRVTMCWDIHPVSIAPDEDGWLLEYRCDEAAPVEVVRLDGDGRVRR